ncbi:MAG: hypothetical protein H0Z33_08625 [Bacillaceae bacterium]|nr:hypothetical protein [Bacillaceae bacterium]
MTHKQKTWLMLGIISAIVLGLYHLEMPLLVLIILSQTLFVGGFGLSGLLLPAPVSLRKMWQVTGWTLLFGVVFVWMVWIGDALFVAGAGNVFFWVGLIWLALTILAGILLFLMSLYVPFVVRFQPFAWHQVPLVCLAFVRRQGDRLLSGLQVGAIATFIGYGISQIIPVVGGYLFILIMFAWLQRMYELTVTGIKGSVPAKKTDRVVSVQQIVYLILLVVAIGIDLYFGVIYFTLSIAIGAILGLVFVLLARTRAGIVLKWLLAVVAILIFSMVVSVNRLFM